MRIGISIATGLCLAVVTPALARGFTDCPQDFYSMVMPPGLADFDQYGAAIASTGDWLFVSAPMDDQLETDAGAVYVFKLTGKDWTFHQKLLATGGLGPAHFGFSIAADGEALIVGAEFDQEVTQTNPSAWGAAYLFNLQNDQWIQQQKVFGFGPGDARHLGYAVAIEGEVVVIGARIIANDTTPGKGAAYVYRLISDVLLPEQKLTADVPSAFDLFGTAIAIHTGHIVIGASGNDAVGSNAGAAFVFSHDGSQWIQEAALHSTTPAANDRFGEKVDIHGDTAMISAALPDLSGMVFVFRKQAGTWSAVQQLVAPDGAAEDRFGSALDMHGDVLVIGAPHHELDSSKQAGVCYVARFHDGAWTMERQLTLFNPNDFPPVTEFDSPYECWLAGPPPADWPQPPALDSNKFGTSTAVVQGRLLASSAIARPWCWGETPPLNAGAMYRFDVAHPLSECFLAVGYDNCSSQPDCNGNHSPDSCDLDASSSADCNVNGVPDECDQGSAYVLPGCPGWIAIPQSGDYIWLNQHRVKPGGQIISHISFARSPFIPEQTPVTVLLYSDPNEDGDPADAVLLASAETTSASAYYGGPNYHTFVSIAPTYVGPVGSFFFIGAVIRTPYADPGWNAPIACTGTGGLKRSWRAIAPSGEADIHDLANNATPVSLHLNVRRWEVAAFASDCNGNGIWDACDIASGELLDADNNGIPDTCDVPACFFADIEPLHGDGQVNVLDLLQVITNWGVCEPCYAICPGDTNDDCATNVIDLLAVINGWGACGK